QPHASPVGIVRAVVVESALRRLYPVSCALQIGNGVLPRLRSRAFPARSLRRHPGENGRLELLRGRHWATPIYLRLGTVPRLQSRRGTVSATTITLLPTTTKRSGSTPILPLPSTVGGRRTQIKATTIAPSPTLVRRSIGHRF